jgi:hypothetical protein
VGKSPQLATIKAERLIEQILQKHHSLSKKILYLFIKNKQTNMSEGYKIRDQYKPHYVTFTVTDWVDVFSRRTKPTKNSTIPRA